jgi:hypothetical protein
VSAAEPAAADPATITADKRMVRGIDVIANLIFSPTLYPTPPTRTVK